MDTYNTPTPEVAKMIDVLRKIKDYTPEQIEDVLYEVAKISPLVFVHAYNRSGIDYKALDLELALMASSGDTLIPCIKRYRELTGAGLKESKEYVESLNLFGRN